MIASTVEPELLARSHNSSPSMARRIKLGRLESGLFSSPKVSSDTMVIGEKYSENQRQQFKDKLNEILGTNYAQIKTIFTRMKLNYTMERVTKNGKINKKKITDRDKKDILFTDKVISV